MSGDRATHASPVVELLLCGAALAVSRSGRARLVRMRSGLSKRARQGNEPSTADDAKPAVVSLAPRVEVVSLGQAPRGVHKGVGQPVRGDPIAGLPGVQLGAHVDRRP